jgi:hypothetical protein
MTNTQRVVLAVAIIAIAAFFGILADPLWFIILLLLLFLFI